VRVAVHAVRVIVIRFARSVAVRWQARVQRHVDHGTDLVAERPQQRREGRELPASIGGGSHAPEQSTSARWRVAVCSTERALALR
jgi:hypothetical protein